MHTELTPLHGGRFNGASLMYRAASDLQSDPPRFAAAAAAAAAFSCTTGRTTCPELSSLRVDLTYGSPVERYFNDTLSGYYSLTLTRAGFDFSRHLTIRARLMLVRLKRR